MGSSIEFIKAYTDNYLKKLEPKGGPLTQRDDALVESYSSVDDLLGKNSRFSTFFTNNHVQWGSEYRTFE